MRQGADTPVPRAVPVPVPDLPGDGDPRPPASPRVPDLSGDGDGASVPDLPGGGGASPSPICVGPLSLSLHLSTRLVRVPAVSTGNSTNEEGS
jgi:hypothetical protein